MRISQDGVNNECTEKSQDCVRYQGENNIVMQQFTNIHVIYTEVEAIEANYASNISILFCNGNCG